MRQVYRLTTQWQYEPNRFPELIAIDEGIQLAGLDVADGKKQAETDSVYFTGIGMKVDAVFEVHAGDGTIFQRESTDGFGQDVVRIPEAQQHLSIGASKLRDLIVRICRQTGDDRRQGAGTGRLPATVGTKGDAR